jgi:hypothetical protein
VHRLAPAQCARTIRLRYIICIIYFHLRYNNSVSIVHP